VAERKDRMALLSRYSKLHTLRYEEKPIHNINKEQWAADGLIESYGMPTCYELMQYYFDVSPSPSWPYFANYTDKIIQARKRLDRDLQERAERRKMAKAWLNE
jgi:hypothetical protein